MERTKKASPKEKVNLEKKREQELLKLRADFRKVFNCPEGYRVLRYLQDQCGFTVSNITVNKQTGEINQSVTIYNEAYRNVYLDIRSKLDRETLIKAEFGNKEG